MSVSTCQLVITRRGHFVDHLAPNYVNLKQNFHQTNTEMERKKPNSTLTGISLQTTVFFTLALMGCLTLQIMSIVIGIQSKSFS